MSQEDRVRERAHQIWETNGRPEGRDAEHWAQAEREIAEEIAAKDAASGHLVVTPFNDPTRPGGAVEGGSYPTEEKKRRKA